MRRLHVGTSDLDASDAVTCDDADQASAAALKVNLGTSGCIVGAAQDVAA